MVFFYDVPKRRGNEVLYDNVSKVHKVQEEDFNDSDMDSSQHAKATNITSTESNPFMSSHGDGTFEKLQTMKRAPKKGTPQHTFMESITNVRRLMTSNIAFPTTVAILFIVKTATEVILSSCGTIAHLYLDWSGARSGLFMSLLASVRLPYNMHLAMERSLTERSIMKAALSITRYGLMLMINYESIYLFIKSIFNGGMKNDLAGYNYDGIFGTPQYMLSFAVVFISIITLGK